MGVVHPLVTLSKDGATYNFDKSYVVGFPTAINLLKSDKLGFSFEVVPFIKAQGHDSKMDRILFHPGIIFRGKNGFSFTARTAFETNGRYGFTPVFTKIIKKGKESSPYLSLVLPTRFGDATPASVSIGLHAGVLF